MKEKVKRQDGSSVPIAPYYESSLADAGRKYIIGVADNSTKEINVGFFDMRKVEDRWKMWSTWKDQQIKTLATVIRSQQRLLEYNSYYSAFLLGQLTEDDFQKAAAKFAYKQEQCDVNELTYRIGWLTHLTDLDFSVSDLAEIFQCNQDVIRQAISDIERERIATSSQG